MASAGQVLSMLLPDGGYVIHGEDFDSIVYDEGITPITKAAFTAGFAAYDAWKSQQDQAKAEAKAALLARLGMTAEEAALLLS